MWQTNRTCAPSTHTPWGAATHKEVSLRSVFTAQTAAAVFMGIASSLQTINWIQTHLISCALFNSDYTALNCTVTHEWWIGRDSEGRRRHLNRSFAWRERENPRYTSFRIAGAPTNIRIEDFQYTNLERYRYVILLSKYTTRRPIQGVPRTTRKSCCIHVWSTRFLCYCNYISFLWTKLVHGYTDSVQAHIRISDIIPKCRTVAEFVILDLQSIFRAKVNIETEG
jgi:hypothetical protein